MKHKEKLTFEEVCGETFKVRLTEASEYGKASLTHYLHNYTNGVSKSFKKEAISHVKRALEYKFPNEDITSKVAEDALQYMLFKLKKDVPFPEPEKPKFKFIDLFAGIGGFRIAMQELGGKCIFTSEWDEQAKKTYEANFGEVPFGDITKAETKRFIPDGFDVLCAGFPCQAFSIAGKRGGFEDTRGTLFFDIEQIIEKHRPKVVFLENVKNLVSHDYGKTFKVIIEILEEKLGYKVFHKVLNSMTHANVPQNRERIFIVAFDPKQVKNYKKFKFPSEIKLTNSIHDILEQGKQDDKYYYHETHQYYPELAKMITKKDTVYQ